MLLSFTPSQLSGKKQKKKNFQQNPTPKPRALQHVLKVKKLWHSLVQAWNEFLA